MAVVKADAYGHGIEPIAKVCDEWGVTGYAVISLEEAQRIRSVSNRDVLIMGFLTDSEYEEANRSGFLLSLYDIELVPILIGASRTSQKPARVHLKVETGLNRLGIEPSDALDLLNCLSESPEIRIESVFSHLANSADQFENARQWQRFQPVLNTARSMRVEVSAHLTKSHALKPFPESFLSFVRVGLAVYGFEEVIPGLIPALTAKSVVMQRKKLRAGDGVSYLHMFRADRDMEIAVVAMGYSEGLSLSMSEKIDMLVNGHRVRQIGRICMNLCMIDVTGIPAKRGDEVVVIGTQGSETIRACDIAERTGLRQHEIVTRIGKSLPKRYFGSSLESELN
jgi:alanine racemase